MKSASTSKTKGNFSSTDGGGDYESPQYQVVYADDWGIWKAALCWMGLILILTSIAFFTTFDNPEAGPMYLLFALASVTVIGVGTYNIADGSGPWYINSGSEGISGRLYTTSNEPSEFSFAWSEISEIRPHDSKNCPEIILKLTNGEVFKINGLGLFSDAASTIRKMEGLRDGTLQPGKGTHRSSVSRSSGLTFNSGIRMGRRTKSQ